MKVQDFLGQWLSEDFRGLPGSSNQAVLNLDYLRGGALSGTLQLSGDESDSVRTLAIVFHLDDNGLHYRAAPNHTSAREEWFRGTCQVYPDSMKVSITLPAHVWHRSVFLIRSGHDHKWSTQSQQMTWREFCQWAFESHKHGWLYRGQGKSSHMLKTSFHRTGRCDLSRYWNEECHDLRRHLSALLGRRFDLANPRELLELLSLAQHHGYPTPLLDWTESPFIAAFFAFERAYESNDCVSVYRYAPAAFGQHRTHSFDLLSPRIALAAIPAEGTDNARSLAQQSVVTFSNVVDIEGLLSHFWIKFTDDEPREAPALRSIIMQSSERAAALSDLRAMGITRASLFPGIDGTCRELAARHFGIS